MAEKTAKAATTEKKSEAAKTAKTEKAAKTVKTSAAENEAKTEKTAKAEKATKTEKTAKSVKADSADKTANTGRLKITLIKSKIGQVPKARATITAMGLRKIGQTVELPDNGATRGQIQKVRHMVKVEEA